MGLLKTTAKAAKKLADEWDEAAWLKENPRPHPDIRPKDMTKEQHKQYRAWHGRKDAAKHPERVKANNAKQYKENREAHLARKREYGKKNKDKIRQRNKAQYKKSRESRLAYSKKYYEGNKDAIREAEKAKRAGPEGEKIRAADRERYQANIELKREQARERYQADPASHKASASNARARRAQRNAKFADQEEIRRIYEQAGLLSESTGTPYEVDHVFPLQGKNVSGLHVPGNMMITPRNLNRSKKASFTPGDDPMRFNDVAQRNIKEQNAKGLLDGFADPRLLAGIAGTTAAGLAAPMIKDSGMISSPRSETLFDLTMGARDVERRLEGSPASLLFPSGLIDYLETVNRREEKPNAMTRGMALLDVLPF